MRKILALILLTLLLCGCGNAAPAPTAAPTEAPVETTAAPEMTAASETTEPTETEPETTEEPSLREIALALVDHPVEELYEAIGYPESSDYAPSCLVNGDDGNLYYEDFTVYTIRTSDGETVYDVE